MHRPPLPVMIALLGLACADARPAAIVADADPFLFNGPALVSIPARVVATDGSTLTGIPLQALSNDTSVLRVEDGGMQCIAGGDADLALSAGSLRSTMRIQCRPVVSFAPFGSAELVVGGEPQDIPIVAFGPDGQVVEALRFSARSRDSAIVEVRDGRLVPKALGATQVELEFGGIRTTASTEVVELLTDERLALAAGEYRSWELPAGRYRAQVFPLSAAGDTDAMQLRSSRANCARDSRERGTLHCVVADRGSIVLSASRPVSARIRIVQRPR